MKKNALMHLRRYRPWLPKMLLIMKFTFLFMTVLFVHSYASSYGQNVTIMEKNATLETVVKQLRQQTGFDFLLDKEALSVSKKINIQVRNVSLQEVLKLISKEHGLSFTLEGKSVVITKSIMTSSTKNLDSNNNVRQQGLAGLVIDEKGTPLIGATVKVKGSTLASVTDNKGFFRFERLEVGDILEITYVGYKINETAVTSGQLAQKEYFIIHMKPLTENLEEITIVNTGYQKISRENVTGSVTTIGSKELGRRNAVNIMENLEGVVPGLVQYQGKASIRGVSTLDANANILIVVDGLPIEGSVSDLNPYDVESISVLKDAAAAAIYGARASNGVIVVTTKNAQEKGKTVVEAAANLTLTQKPDYSYNNYMTPSQQVEWESNYYKWWFSGGNGSVANPINQLESDINTGNPISPIRYGYYQLTKNQISQTQLDAVLDSYRQNDFAKEYREHALLKGIGQQYNLALRTNNGRTQNNLVINYTSNNQGIINAFDKRINLHYKGTYTPDKWLDINYGVNSVIGKTRAHNSQFATTPFNVPSYYRLLNEDGSRAYYTTNRFNAYNNIFETIPGLYSAEFNHLDELERDFKNTSSLHTRYYVNMDIRPIKGLILSPMFQYEDIRTDISGYSEAESYTMRWLQNVYTKTDGTYGAMLPKGGKLNTSAIRSPNYTARMQANYDRSLEDHRIIALAGFEIRQTRNYGQHGILLGYDDQLQTQFTNNVNFNDLFNRNMGTFWNMNYPTRQYHFFEELSTMGLERDEMHRFASGYANLTYSFKQKYNLFGSLRKDYADLFGGDERYRGKPLWSMGASWVVSNEDFIKSYTWINYLKLRTSYGLTGNIKNVTARLAATSGTNNLTQLPNATVSNPPNDQLRWEKTATTNVGIDFSTFDNRLKGTLDWYHRKGTDLFAVKRMDPSEGFNSMIINNASMVNKGIEFSLSYDWMRSESLVRWTSQLTGAWNKNKITEVDELTRNPITLAGGGSYKVGYPVNSIFSFRFAGLDDMGMAQWFNTAGIPTKTTLGPTEAEAIVYSGSEDPKVNIGFNNDFSYKGFDIGIYAIYYGGHHFRARPVPLPYQMPNYGSLPSYLLESWSPTNKETDVPGSGEFYQIPPTNQYYYSDNLVRKSDFIKIRNIVFGYTLPQQISSKVRANNLRIRLQLNNPKSIWIKQNDVHVDPETGGAPIPTSFVFGVNANF